MTHLVACTFDLKNASWEDYQRAYRVLGVLGLKKVIVADSGKEVVAPTTMVFGKIMGTTAGSVRDDIRQKIQNAFSGLGLTSEIFVIVGGDWAWEAATT